jgi:AcrR family transcriptional regulator
MSRREEAKAERRRRIVAAARDLIKETGNTGLSMRAIAARAGVSLTTPYSLFGSKRGIVIALLDDIRTFHERFSQVRRAGAVDRIFQAVDISLAYLADDPVFYRTLWTEALRSDSKELRGELQSAQRYDFWFALLDQARREGALLPAVAIDPLLRALDAVFVAAMLGWVLGTIEAHELKAHVDYGYALTLRGAACGAAQEELAARLLAGQRALAEPRAAVPSNENGLPVPGARRSD